MVILRKDQQPSFVTWDVKDSLEITTRFVLIDEYAPAFDRDYQSIPVRFSRWREYRPSAFNQTNP